MYKSHERGLGVLADKIFWDLCQERQDWPLHKGHKGEHGPVSGNAQTQHLEVMNQNTLQLKPVSLH